MNAQPCNNPLTGKGIVVDDIGGALVSCLLCGNTDADNVLDGDLSNYAEFAIPATVLLTTPIISIKDVENDYPAGRRTGFVVETPSGLLTSTLLGSLQIRTYLNNTLRESISTGGGLTVSLLAGSGGKQRISFVSSQSFDEVELVLTSGLGLLGTMRLYYAYEEPANGCDYECRTPLVSGTSGFSPAINNAATGITGVLCLLCDIVNEGNVVNASLTDYGRIVLTAGVAVTGTIAVNLGGTVPAGSTAGFMVRNDGALGLLSATLLGATHIDLYRSGSLKQSFAANSPLVGLNVLSDDIQALSVDADSSFDQIRIRVNGISVGVNMRVYYAFYAPDSDNDDFPNCVDKCANNNDNLDADGDGTPDGCDLTAACMPAAGLSVAVCPPATTAQLPAAGSGQSWSAVSGNPAAATVNNAGQVSGLSTQGTYLFALAGPGSCADTVAVVVQESALAAACNNPISGPHVVTYDPPGGGCLLCLSLGGNVIDADQSTYATVATISLLGGAPVIGVRDTLQDYPAGRRVGFVVQAVGGVLNLSLLNNFQIRTYLNGSLQETASVGNALLTAGAVPGPGNRQRLSFVTTLPFDAVVLYNSGAVSVSLLSALRIYYVFEEPASGCPDQSVENCQEAIVAGSDYCGDIVEDRTGLSGAACVGCVIKSIGHLIDADLNNFTEITQGVTALSSASVSVKLAQTVDAGYEVGFVIANNINLLDLSVLGGLRLRTYMNGTPVDDLTATSGLVDLNLIAGSSGLGLITLRPTGSINEIRLTVTPLIAALATVNVYYAFARQDTDQDGTPNCLDKCCLGSDNIDTDSDGEPDPCDPIADLSLRKSASNNSPAYGATVTFTLKIKNAGPANATAISARDTLPSGLTDIGSISNGGLLSGNQITWSGLNLNAGDSLSLTFTAKVVRNGNYTNRAEITGCAQQDLDASPSQTFGTDDLADNTPDDDESTLALTPVNTVPLAQNDTANTPEDTSVSISVLTNDTDPNGDALTLSAALDPPHGTVQVIGNTVLYTPDANYTGTDVFQYIVCDVDNACDTASVTVTVTAINDAPVANNDTQTTPEDTPVTFSATANDTDVDGMIDPATLDLDPGTAGIQTSYSVAGGTFTTDGLGNVTFTPDLNYNGPATASYSVCDSGTPLPALCATATISVTVTAVNDAPVANNDTQTTPEDTPVAFSATANDTDVDGMIDPATLDLDPGTAGLQTTYSVAGGTFTTDGSGNVSFTPALHFAGTASIPYSICDTGTPLPAQCATATISVTVTAVNDAPVANADNVTTPVSTPIVFNPLSNDTDVDSALDSSSVTLIVLPGHGTAMVNPVSGAITYTPVTNFYGSDSLSYAVCDQGIPALCDTAWVYFAVLPPPELCNIPLVGKGRVVDQVSGGAACVLCANNDLENIVDGDLDNYSTYNPALILLSTPVVSVKDVENDFAGGQRTGFVVQPTGGLLSASILGNFQLRTYLNNVLQESLSGSALSLLNLGTSGGKQRISAVTTLTFDEVELVQTATVGALSGIRVFYVFVEPASGCDYDCRTEVVPPAYAATLNGSNTGISGLLCLLCDVVNEGNVVNSNTTDFGRIILTAGLGVQGAIAVHAGDTIPAGYDAGFVIAQNGSGLLSASVLNATFIETYLGGNLLETVPFSNLADIAVLGGNRQSLSFTTTQAFDQLRIRVNSLLAVAVNMNVYYAFVRPDDDSDGFPNCVDKCAGADDGFDADGDGLPDACDTLDCMVNAGLDVSACPPGGVAQLPAAGPGQSWTALAGNPVAASVNNAGQVSGMTLEGAYAFRLSGANGCADTVTVLYQTSALGDSCNNPILGYGVIPFDPSGGNCLLCLTAGLVLDGLLNTAVSLDASVSIASGTPLVGVMDTLQTYPAGRRVGFVVESVGGLLDLSVLNNFEIRTYLDGNLQESASVGNTLLEAGILPGPGNRQRIAFVTTQPFDAVVLVANALLSTIDSFRIYYAFEEPASGCPDLATENCVSPWLVHNEYCAGIVYEHTGLDGVACVGCQLQNIGNLIDDDPSTAATVTLAVGVGAQASVAIHTVQTLDEQYQVGFVLSGGAQLLDATVLAGLQLRTYLNGVLVDNYVATNGLVDITILATGSNPGLVSFRPTGAFNEIRLTLYGLVNALQTTQVYYAFARRDSDQDNTPDCIDKCCSGSDDVDTDGDGSPDDCDLTNDPPVAVNDPVTTPEDTPVYVPVLLNDVDPNADTLVVSALTDPPHGTATLFGDSILYTPDAHFYGQDTLFYTVCDQQVPPLCDTAMVIVTVSAVDVRLTLKMRLQGALFNSPDTTLMRDDLRFKGHLPATEPYSALPAFVHVNGGGGELVANTETVFAALGANSIVDWVFVELRDSANPSLVVATRSGLLQRDGDVVEVDGVSALEFDNSGVAFYYVAVRHRNHLGTMTANPIALSATGTTVDFTNLGTPLWDDGTNLNGYEQVTLWGKFALWAGNVNTDNKVVFAGQANDKDPIFNQIDQAPANFLRSQTYVFNGYHLGDVNLSGAAIFAGQNNDVDFIFNNVDGHPRNFLRSQTFIIRQQLAP